MSLEPVKNYAHHQGLAPIVVGILFVILAAICVVLRMVCRKMKDPENWLAADDYMIFLALFLMVIYVAGNIFGVIYAGIGTHADEVTPAQLALYYKVLMALILLWTTCLAAVKISLLLLYSRVFRLKWKAHLVMGIVVAWWLIVVLIEFLLCKPVAFTWDPTIPNGTCGNILGAWVATGVINLVTDVVVLALPIPAILALHLPLRTRKGLLGVFGLGFCVCVFTCVRLAFIVHYNVHDPTFSLWETAVWSQLEPLVGIICCCLTLMKPILDLCTPRKKVTAVKGSGGNALPKQNGGRQTLGVNNDEAYPLTKISTSATSATPATPAKVNPVYEELSGSPSKPSGAEEPV